jgi:hypothetical protein
MYVFTLQKVGVSDDPETAISPHNDVKMWGISRIRIVHSYLRYLRRIIESAETSSRRIDCNYLRYVWNSEQ